MSKTEKAKPRPPLSEVPPVASVPYAGWYFFNYDEKKERGKSYRAALNGTLVTTRMGPNRSGP